MSLCWKVDDERERSCARKEAERVARRRAEGGARFTDLFGRVVDVAEEEDNGAADPAVAAFVRAVIEDHLREKQATDNAIDMAFMSRDVLEMILADDRTSAESRGAVDYALRFTVPYVERRVNRLMNSPREIRAQVAGTGDNGDGDEPPATAAEAAQHDPRILHELQHEAEAIGAGGEWMRFTGMWDEAFATYAATHEKKRKRA